jgi:copper chaperone CopZ
MSTTSYGVTGMTCAHCVAAVTDEIGSIAGVSNVAIDLVVGGTSRVTVTSAEPLPMESVRDAIDEAGYTLSA